MSKDEKIGAVVHLVAQGECLGENCPAWEMCKRMYANFDQITPDQCEEVWAEWLEGDDV